MVLVWSVVVLATTTISDASVDAFAPTRFESSHAATIGNNTPHRSPRSTDAVLCRSFSCVPMTSRGSPSPQRLPLVKLFSTGGDGNGEGEQEDEEKSLTSLQNTLASIEALEERNAAQLESFVDEEDQWESMEIFEQELLSSKENVLKQLEGLSDGDGVA